MGSLWAYTRRMVGIMCVVAGMMVSWSAPDGSIDSKYTFFPNNEFTSIRVLVEFKRRRGEEDT